MNHVVDPQEHRVLVVGGSGYVGSWITKYLRSHGFYVKTLGKTSGDLQCDMTNTRECRDVVGGAAFDTVVLVAGTSHAERPEEQKAALDMHVMAIEGLLAGLHEVKRLNRVIRISSFHVYGQIVGDIDEGTLLVPRTGYARAHQAGEERLREFSLLKNVPCTNLRLTNAYGRPESRSKSGWSLVMNDLCLQAATQPELRLRGNGKQVRDMVWLGDVGEAVARLTLGVARADDYNLSSEFSLSVWELAERLSVAFERRTGRRRAVVCLSGEGPEEELPLRVRNGRLCEALGMKWHDRIESEANRIWDLWDS